MRARSGARKLVPSAAPCIPVKGVKTTQDTLKKIKEKREEKREETSK